MSNNKYKKKNNIALCRQNIKFHPFHKGKDGILLLSKILFCRSLFTGTCKGKSSAMNLIHLMNNHKGFWVGLLHQLI